MSDVQSALKYYNANTRDAHSPDCVKRALTLAYGLDYDDVSRELNRIKRDIHADAFNSGRVVNEFIKRRGDSFQKDDRGLTVREFEEGHTSGIYLLSVGKPNATYSDHMCVVMNGDLYDSWDSQDRVVRRICEVHNSSSSFSDDLSGEAVEPAVTEFLQKYVETLNRKIDYGRLVLHNGYQDDTLTYHQSLVFYFDVDVPYDGSKTYWYVQKGSKARKTLILKLNPTFDVDKNIEVLKKKTKQKIYDWYYEINKYIRDSLKSQQIETNPRFHGNRRILANLPEWAWPLITSIYDNGTPGEDDGYDRYEVYMEALPDDPRYKTDREVSFYADTITELKDCLAMYKKNFSRFGYDY